MSVIDFNGFDKGVIGKKLPSDTTLNNMRKADLIELLHLAESNHRVLAEAYKIAIDTSKCNTCPLSLNGEESYQKGRADAIEEFVKALEEHQQKNWVDNLEYGITFADIEEVAEELKEKKE